MNCARLLLGDERGQRTVYQNKLAKSVTSWNRERSLCRSLANLERHWACNDRRSIGSRNSTWADYVDLERDCSAKTHVNGIVEAAIFDGGGFLTSIKWVLGLDRNGRSTAISLNEEPWLVRACSKNEQATGVSRRVKNCLLISWRAQHIVWNV